MTPEAKIESAVRDWAFSRGIMSVKFTPAGSNGWPDRMFILPGTGTVVFIEFKAPGEELRTLQEYRIKQLTDQGAFAYWADSVEKAKLILKNHLEAIQR
jgi:hypothetical protein